MGASYRRGGNALLMLKKNKKEKLLAYVAPGVAQSVAQSASPLWLLAQEYVEKEVFVVPKWSTKEVKKPTGCLWAMSETPK